MEPQIDTPAPNFTLSDQDGNLHTLSDYKNWWVVLYFYPKDNTPGCTKEATNFRDAFAEIQDLGAIVLGVSRDPVDSHKKFHTQYNLPFPLLADIDGSVIDMYGVKGIGSSAKRTSFIINPAGKIAKIYTNVKPIEHAREVADDLRAFTA